MMGTRGGSQPLSTSSKIALRLPGQDLTQCVQPPLGKEHRDRQRQDEDIGRSNASPASIIGVKIFVHILAGDGMTKNRPYPV